MKKRLEAELISIAHRILKLKNKSEVDQLYLESKKLYETLAVLKFYGDNYEVIKNDAVVVDLESKLEAALDSTEETTAPVIEEIPIVAEEVREVEEPIAEKEETTFEDEEVTAEDEEEETVETAKEEPSHEVEEEETVAATEEDSSHEEEKEAISLLEEESSLEDDEIQEEEPVIVGEITIEEEEIEEEVPLTEAKLDSDFEPLFELAAAPMADEETEEIEETPIAETAAINSEADKNDEPKQITFADLLGENYTEPVFVKPDNVVVPPSLKNVIDEQGKSLNEMHSKTINIGLNDKIAFVKHLFADSTEDYNRVLSQLNTFSSLSEAKAFIDEIIKPDYNNWEGVDDYAERFIAIVAKKFS
jgi:hypothetical protein